MITPKKSRTQPTKFSLLQLLGEVIDRQPHPFFFFFKFTYWGKETNYWVRPSNKPFLGGRHLPSRTHGHFIEGAVAMYPCPCPCFLACHHKGLMKKRTKASTSFSMLKFIEILRVLDSIFYCPFSFFFFFFVRFIYLVLGLHPFALFK